MEPAVHMLPVKFQFKVLNVKKNKTPIRVCSMFEFQVPQLNLKFRPFEIVESYNAMTSYGCHRWRINNNNGLHWPCPYDTVIP